METDVLGPPYERQTIELGSDDEGPVVATLVRRRAEEPTRRAVLYVHGFIDYFFQTHLADFFVERGWDFYALDLRKYGRSLLAHQTPNFCRDLGDYFPELDEAARIIRAEDG
ncbi:MAG TPA: alpha/beta hydrolase, partial [Catenuloplanes sp.]